MSTKVKLRICSLVMLIVAVIFVLCALSNPGLGRTIYIGGFKFGAEQWRICYAFYIVVMLGLFIASFLIKRKKTDE